MPDAQDSENAMTDAALPPQTAPRTTAATPARVMAASRPTPLGIYDKPRHEMVTSIEVIAIGLSAIWLLGAAAFFIFLFLLFFYAQLRIESGN